MKKYLTLPLIVFISALCYSQQNDTTVFVTVEGIPLFAGGDIYKFSNYIHENLVYPKFAYDNNISGKVFVTFTVDVNLKPEKRLTNVHVLKGLHPSLNYVAIQLVENAPNLWTSGKSRGKNKPVSFVVPVIFDLENINQSALSDKYDEEIYELLQKDSLTIYNILYKSSIEPVK